MAKHCRGGSRIFFRRGCTRLLLYFNTNKPHSFFFGRIPVVLDPPLHCTASLLVLQTDAISKIKNDILQKTGTTLNKTHPTKQKWTNNNFHNTQETSTLLKMISSFLSQQVMLAKLLTFNSHEYQPADYTGTSELAHCIRLTIQRSQVWALQWPPTQYLFW